MREKREGEERKGQQCESRNLLLPPSSQHPKGPATYLSRKWGPAEGLAFALKTKRNSIEFVGKEG